MHLLLDFALLAAAIVPHVIKQYHAHHVKDDWDPY
jgi:hypothetical protein